MGIFFGQEKRQFIPEPPIPAFYGAPAIGGASSRSQISTSTGLSVPTVWACVGLLANTVSMLPLETFRRTDGVPARITDPTIVTSPSSGMTQSEWLHMLMCSLLLRGNAYGRIVARDTQQRPTQIELLNPDTVSVEVDDQNGALRYRVGGREPIPEAQMWHVRGMTMPGSRVGLSPLSYAAATLGIDLSSREFANDFFSGGGIPKAVLTSDQRIEQDAATRIKARLLEATRRREPLVLGAGLTYSMVQVSPGESQFLETQQANVAQIARYFWIPPEMVGGAGGGSLTYANVEQRSLDFLTYAVSFWLKRIEDAFFTLLPQPEYVRFNTAALLRTDAKTQAEVDQIRITSGVILPTEARATSLQLPPLTDEQKAETSSASANARGLAEMVQKIYLGVGKVITSDEAREIINAGGGNLPPGFTPAEAQTAVRPHPQTSA